MSRSLRFGRLSLILVLAGVSWGVHADSITVANYSFESPRVSNEPLASFGVWLSADGWNLSGPATDTPVNIGGTNYDPNVGIFTNERSDNSGTFFSNADDGSGNGPSNQADAQLAYIFSNPGEQFQQTLSTDFSTGKTYTLTIAAGNAGTPPPATDKLDVTLYYTDPNTGNPVTVGTASVAGGSLAYSDDSSGAPAVALVDFSLTTDPVAGDANNQPINILVSSDAANAGGGEFDFDNVRLVSTPEPASLVFLGVSAMLFLTRRRAGRRL